MNKHPYCTVHSLPFFAFNLTQFLGALNDNVYKLLIVFFLVGMQGVEQSPIILSLSGAIFVLPFIFLSPFAGKIADNISKTTLFRLAKILEIVVMLCGVFAFILKSSLACYFVLFLMAAQSTLFSPAKYGLIPELLEEKEIPKANGWVSLFTYIAIILGSFVASVLTDFSEHNFILSSCFCVFFAVLGTISAYMVPYVPAMKQNKKLKLNILVEVKNTLKKTSSIPRLPLMIVCNTLFFLVASFCQLNLVTFSMTSLGLNETGGGYLYPFLAIGIGIGSSLAGKISASKIRLDFLPIATIGVGFSLLSLYFFQYHFILVVSFLSLLGISGGFFVVPTDSFIQTKSPQQDRGEILANCNVLAFLGVLIGSLLISFFSNIVKITPAASFLSMGFLTIILGGLLYRSLETTEVKNKI